MPLLRVQCALVTSDLISANYATNTLYFEYTDPTDFTPIQAALGLAYGEFDAQMGNGLASTQNLLYKMYDMADPEPRTPVSTGATSLSRTNAICLPHEVSLCLSFQGARVSGINQASRRGRIYLPFIVNTALTTDGRPIAACINAAVAMGDSLLTASDAAGTWTWVVYSPTTGSFTPVTDGWVDNEFDTQRRRGRLPTARTTFT